MTSREHQTRSENRVLESLRLVGGSGTRTGLATVMFSGKPSRGELAELKKALGRLVKAKKIEQRRYVIFGVGPMIVYRVL